MNVWVGYEALTTILGVSSPGTELTLAEDSRFTLSHMGGRSEMDLGQLSQVQLHSDDSEEEATCPLSGTRFDLLGT